MKKNLEIAKLIFDLTLLICFGITIEGETNLNKSFRKIGSYYIELSGNYIIKSIYH